MGDDGCDELTEVEPLLAPGGTGGGRRMAAIIAAEDGEGGVDVTGDVLVDDADLGTGGGTCPLLGWMIGTCDKADGEPKLAGEACADTAAEPTSVTGIATGIETATDFSSSLLSSPFPTSSLPGDSDGSVSSDADRWKPGLNDAACVDFTFFFAPGRRACVSGDEGERSRSMGDCCSASSAAAVALVARERDGPRTSRLARSCLKLVEIDVADGAVVGAALLLLLLLLEVLLVGLLPGDADLGEMVLAACCAFWTVPSSLWKLVQ